MEIRLFLAFAVLFTVPSFAIELREEKTLEQLLQKQPKWVAFGVMRCREEFRSCRGADAESCVKQLDACLGSVVSAIDTKPSAHPMVAEREAARRSARIPASATR